jgi:hypothetical protein
MLEFNSTNNDDCGCDSGSLNGFTDPSCPAPSVVTWNSIQGKPSCFTPCAHTHVPGDIIGLEAYIESVEFLSNITTTNSIQLTAPAGVLNANLRLSANAGVGYKVPLSILGDGLIGQIPYASGSNAGILSSANWTTFNNKFNTPSGTVFQYVRGDGSLATFPTFGTLSSVAIAVPAAFGVVNSPLTSNGTITINALGTISQYIRGDGTLAAFPASPSFLVGSVPFGNGTGLTENNPKFFWDNTLFKLKLTDSKLEFLNTGILGSALLEYKALTSIATLAIDQTSTNSGIGMWIKARAYNNIIGNGQTAGFIFGSVDGVDTTVGQVGMMWNTPNVSGAGNQLFIKNVYDSTGVIKIQATAYTQIDGLAIKQAAIHTFSNVDPSHTIIYPYNVLRFNYGGTSGTNQIILPYNALLAIPDGYIVILKALNVHVGAGQNVVVAVQGMSGQTLEAHTFSTSYQSIVYRFDGTSSKWDIIAKY